MSIFKKSFIVLIAFMLLIPFSLGTKFVTSNVTAEQMFYVRVDLTDPSQIGAIEDSGIKIIETYPAYVYGKATATQFNNLAEQKLLVVKLPNIDTVYIAGKAIYPKNDDSKEFMLNDIPEGLGRDYIIDSKLKYYLIKFKSPAKNEWIQELRLKGIDLIEYFHENAYVVRAEQRMEGEMGTMPFISAITEYLPAFKLPPKYNVKDMKTFLFALIWKGVNLDKLTGDIEKYADGAVIGQTVSEDFSTFLIWIDYAKIANLVRIPDIEYIELLPDKIEGKVNIGKKIIGMNWVDQERPNNIRLNGNGETIAVFDSGCDSTLPDFSGQITRGIMYSTAVNVNSCRDAVSQTQRVCSPSFNYGATRLTNPWCDVWGHGTHVAGIIAGLGSTSDSNRYAGVAPGAKLIIQRITPSWNNNRDYGTTAPASTLPPPVLAYPAKTHVCIAKPSFWDLGGPDAVNEGVYFYDHVPYKGEMNPPPANSIPAVGPYPSFHDVPNVSGEVYGPQYGGAYNPEGGSIPRHPGPPYWAGAAGAFNYAMTDAYTYGARIMNNSWWWYYLRTRQGYSPDPGSETFNTYDYNMISKFVDNFQFYNQDFLTVWAAGDNGRDRNFDSITDTAKDLNGDLTYGDPWINGENQTFFAPAPVKNGITVGACENYRPTINLVYGFKGDANRANFGLFQIDTSSQSNFVINPTEDYKYFYAPDWGSVYKQINPLPALATDIGIRGDLIANANKPPVPPTTTDTDYTYEVSATNPAHSDTAVATRKEYREYPYTVDDNNKYQQTAQRKFGMWALSTRGPTSDGRIKPDLVAPGTMVVGPLSTMVAVNNKTNYPFEYQYTANALTGNYSYMSGTSASAAFVSGAAAIVRQYYRQAQMLNLSPSPTAALVKATLIHGATNMAETGTPNQYDIVESNNVLTKTYNDVIARPDFNQGWGRLNVYKSLFPKAPKVQKYDDNTTGVDTDVSIYKVFVNNLDVPFEVTLAWTDESANPNTWPVLKHNLDLVVIDPAGLIYRGNQFGIAPNQDPNVSVPMAQTTDTKNNVERIVIKDPKMKGEYTINVIPSSLPKAPGGPVKYALIYSGGFSEKPEEAPIPIMNTLTLSILAIALLAFGIFEIRKGIISKNR
jgi:hypothetical protein